MQFANAMIALGNGKRVRSSLWAPGVYIDLSTPQDISVQDQAVAWNFYIPSPTQIPFNQVINGLQNGKSFRRVSWTFSGYVFLGKDGNGNLKILASSGIPYSIDISDFQATDWIEVD